MARATVVVRKETKPVSQKALQTGQRLRAWRKYRRLSQSELAQYLGVSAATIGLWERGQRSIRLEQMLRLALLYWDHLHPREQKF